MNFNVVAKSAIVSENIVGSVSKLFGNNGEVIVKTWDNFPEDIAELLWIEIDSLAVPLYIKSFKKQGNTKAVVVFEDFERVDLAEMLIGKKLYCLESGEDDELDFSYLTSYTLVDLTTDREFKIIKYIDSELNPLLELEGDYLVPIAEDLIDKIDDKKKLIKVKLPDGIYDLD